MALRRKPGITASLGRIGRVMVPLLLAGAIGLAGYRARRPLPEPALSRPPRPEITRVAGRGTSPPAAVPTPQEASQAPAPASARMAPERPGEVSGMPQDDWSRQVEAAVRIKDVLSLKLPPGDPEARKRSWRMLMGRARQLLTSEDARAVLLGDLPALSQEEMVALWDVFWTAGPGTAPGIGSFGEDFARRLSRDLIDLACAQTDPSLRGMSVSLVLQDLRWLSSAEVDALRSLLLADRDPQLHFWAEKLPALGPR